LLILPSAVFAKRMGALVDILALGAAPQLRVCPSCGQFAMAAATLCERCWKRLEPLSRD